MHKARAFFFCAGLLSLALLVPRPALAAWPTDPLVNVPLCTASHVQQNPVTVSDGVGGAIVAWLDQRGSTSDDIYAQRVSAAGAVRWLTDGVPLCTATSYKRNPVTTSDGAGGAIVAWVDTRIDPYGDIYAQRISASGAVQWTVNGVALCAFSSYRNFPTITSDGTGGAIVTWADCRMSEWDIYAQRISAVGAVQWTANGMAICTATGDQARPTVTSDGAGGAIVAWVDYRSGDGSIYAQRISAEGAVQWKADGVALCVGSYATEFPVSTSDGAGGAIVAWKDRRFLGQSDPEIYAQHVSAVGEPQWTANGVVLGSSVWYLNYPTMISDGVGGAIVAWNDPWCSAHAQRISAAGTLQWAADGMAMSAYGSDPVCVTDGAGGAIVARGEYRNSAWDIYAQRVSAAGAIQWTADYVALCTAFGQQIFPAITSDGSGGAIVSWQDGRWGGVDSVDVYAQRVQADGELGGDEPTPILLSLVSADVSKDCITLTWFAGGSRSAVATVYRSTVGGGWVRIGEVMADGRGYLCYADHVEATATRLGYRLGVVEAGVEGFCGETWVDLPALELALDGMHPNPTRGGTLTVHFTLPSADPARVELVDVSGRRVVEREVGSFGAGRHTLDLGEGRRPAPGLYLVCLRQGANTRVSRVVVLE